jgi:hypothetical protein
VIERDQYKNRAMPAPADRTRDHGVSQSWNPETGLGAVERDDGLLVLVDKTALLDPNIRRGDRLTSRRARGQAANTTQRVYG